MPTYSYRCTVCANEFDVRQSFNDDPLTMCEHCGGQLRKLFNSVGVVFKGSGFYRTDSKGSGSSSSSTSALTPEKPAEKSAEKPAEKTEKPATNTSNTTAE
ncbi:MAG: FmdB family transcriptional regulator [Actinomycetaceae bacterium]|nr:FmdB family transcriptional regulator [Actinomycetaceae bacterium]